MKFNVLSIGLIGLFLIPLSPSVNAGTPCLRATKNMFVGCNLAVREEISELVANCRNMKDVDTRNNCFFEDVQSLLNEEFEVCSAQRKARASACRDLKEFRYDLDPLLDPKITYINPNDIPGIHVVNPYVSLAAGHTFVLKSNDGEELVVVHVTDQIREIQGAACRVVVDVVLNIEEDNGSQEYTPLEVTDDWFAQDTNGNVYYCGEDVRDFEGSVLISIDGAFEAGRDYAKAGVLIRSNPTVGQAHRTEFALGEAEDIIQYMSLATSPGAAEGGENPKFPCNGNCLQTFDYSPLDPESTENKYYLPGVGIVASIGLENGQLTGDREDLVCVGDSLASLKDPSCGIDDPSELLEKLCELSPKAFCSEK